MAFCVVAGEGELVLKGRKRRTLLSLDSDAVVSQELAGYFEVLVGRFPFFNPAKEFFDFGFEEVGSELFESAVIHGESPPGGTRSARRGDGPRRNGGRRTFGTGGLGFGRCGLGS